MNLTNTLKEWESRNWPSDVKRPPAGEWSDKWVAAAFRVRCRVEPGWVSVAVVNWPLEVIALGPLIGKVPGLFPQDTWPPGGDDWRDAVRGFCLFEHTFGGGTLMPEGVKLAEDLQREIEAENARRCRASLDRTKQKDVTSDNVADWSSQLF